jgi:hypothetical protein
VLKRLRDQKLYISPKKCVFMSKSMEFLGFMVGEDGLRVNPRKLEVIQTWPRPASITEIRRFLGLVQFFRRFIARFSEIAIPVTNLTKKNQSVANWDEKCEHEFEELMKAVKSAPILQSPNWTNLFCGHIDASMLSVCGTLTQMDEYGRKHPVAFYSKKLRPLRRNTPKMTASFAR